MIVQAQIESKKAWENLDGILSVRGLTGVAGGPNDFAASLGHPGEPDHPERVAASADVEKRARSAGKTAGGGGGALMVHATILAAGREFVAKHRGSKLPR
jgi:4-hydroxy-2-oxoheptanedioate aldolase